MKLKIIIFLITLMFCLSIDSVIAQPPPPSSGHGNTGDVPAGGGAPIAGGIGILVSLGVAYGARKWYLSKKEQ
ncbi:MAG: hypothetical protein K9H64_23830 [Bacteroidales bacterium]|nr:hypothetical protein [Bacteroidales bacterium]MCF8457791.1 hypothetical protein [Bacteroidales bacterium]